MLRFVLGFVFGGVVVGVVIGGVLYLRRHARMEAIRQQVAQMTGVPGTVVRFVSPEGFERLLQDVAADEAAEDGLPPKDKLN